MSEGKQKLFSEAVKDALAGLDRRQRDILEKRYGLAGREPLTLAAIGADYRITRERVRQIEALALSSVKPMLVKDAAFNKFLQAAKRILSANGGIKREDLFLQELKSSFGEKTSEQEFAACARFILEASGAFFYSPEDHEWHSHWYLHRDHTKKAKAFVDEFSGVLAGAREAVLVGKRFGEFLTKHIRAHGIPEPVARNYLTASKKFAANRFGDTGLSVWPEIHPRTARDWAYLILKKEEKPLHFREISSLIKAHRADKVTNPSTVHNELIKDDRFILVGRGIYGLKEFGILPGTAREVIAHFLKREGPMRSKDLVRAVLQVRPFKENTILINLQNKNHFRCLEDGRYCVKES